MSSAPPLAAGRGAEKRAAPGTAGAGGSPPEHPQKGGSNPAAGDWWAEGPEALACGAGSRQTLPKLPCFGCQVVLEPKLCLCILVGQMEQAKAGKGFFTAKLQQLGWESRAVFQEAPKSGRNQHSHGRQQSSGSQHVFRGYLKRETSFGAECCGRPAGTEPCPWDWHSWVGLSWQPVPSLAKCRPCCPCRHSPFPSVLLVKGLHCQQRPEAGRWAPWQGQHLAAGVPMCRWAEPHQQQPQMGPCPHRPPCPACMALAICDTSKIKYECLGHQGCELLDCWGSLSLGGAPRAWGKPCHHRRRVLG